MRVMLRLRSSEFGTILYRVHARNRRQVQWHNPDRESICSGYRTTRSRFLAGGKQHRDIPPVQIVSEQLNSAYGGSNGSAVIYPAPRYTLPEAAHDFPRTLSRRRPIEALRAARRTIRSRSRAREIEQSEVGILAALRRAYDSRDRAAPAVCSDRLGYNSSAVKPARPAAI